MDHQEAVDLIKKEFEAEVIEDTRQPEASKLEEAECDLRALVKTIPEDQQFMALADLRESKYKELPESLLKDMLLAIREEQPSLKMANSLAMLKETVTSCFPYLWNETLACLSVMATLLLDDLKNPVGLNLIGPPSSGKTTVLSFFYGIKGVSYRTDFFSPKSFVSHASNVKKKDLEKIDLLPRIKNKVFIVSELAPLFGGRNDDVLDNCKNLLRVFDGEGMTSDSGSCGRRGYEEEILFSWLGASTPLPYQIWDIMGKLGNRLLFWSIPERKRPEQEVCDQLIGKISYKEKVSKCKEAANTFVVELFSLGVGNIAWDREQDPKEVIEVIVKLAKLMAKARGLVRVSADRLNSEQMKHTSPIVEEPDRAAMILYSLARGHAIVHGRRRLTEEDLPILARVTMSTSPEDRRRILPALFANGGKLRTSEVMAALRCSRPKALISMEALAALGICDQVDDPDSFTKPEAMLILSEELEWFLGEEFRAIWQPEIIKSSDPVRRK